MASPELLRQANDRAAAIAAELTIADAEGHEWEFVCECGNCDGAIVRLTLDQFYDRRARGDHLIVALGH